MFEIINKNIRLVHIVISYFIFIMTYLYPLKTSENRTFFYDFRGYRNVALETLSVEDFREYFKCTTNGTKYSRMEQVKFVEGSLYKS